jgi:hypothetical protein
VPGEGGAAGRGVVTAFRLPDAGAAR